MGVGPHGFAGVGPREQTKERHSPVRITRYVSTLLSTTVYLLLSVAFPAAAQEPTPLTPQALEAALTAKPQGPDADRLAERIRTYFGAEALLKGAAAPKNDDVAQHATMPEHEDATVVSHDQKRSATRRRSWDCSAEYRPRSSRR